MQQRTHAHLLLVVTQKAALARDVSLDRLGLCGSVSARVLRAAAVCGCSRQQLHQGATTRVAAGGHEGGRGGEIEPGGICGRWLQALALGPWGKCPSPNPRRILE